MEPPKRNPDGTMQVIDPMQGGAVVTYNPASSSTPISSATMTPSTPITPVVPQTPIVVPPTFTPEEQQSETNLTTAQRRMAEISGQVSQPMQSVFRGAQESQQDVTGKRGAVSSFQNQLSQLSNEYKGIQLQLAQKQEELSQGAVGRYGLGALGSMQEGERMRSQGALLQNAIKQYAVGAQLAAAQGDLATALDYVDRAVKAEFEPKMAQLEAEKANLEALKADPNLTSAERKRVAQIEMEKTVQVNKIQQEREDRQIVYGWIAEAQANGAPPILTSKAATQSPQEALATLGAYFQKPYAKEQALLDLEYKRAQKNLLDAQVSKTLADTEKTREEKATAAKMSKLDPNSPTFTLDAVRASSGGKIPTGEQTKPLNKAVLVLDQVANLKNDIRNTNTDPILGILRDNNPYDVKARAINAQLRAIVPNLARGIYGEVGVLTDADIANYIQTLPNLRTPEEANDLVLDMTLRVIGNSFETQLQTLAAEGRDVSGFEPMLSRFESKLSKAGYIKPKGSETDAAFVERVVGSSGQSYEEILSLANPGEIAVVNNETGQIEFIPAESFTNKYTRL